MFSQACEDVEICTNPSQKFRIGEGVEILKILPKFSDVNQSEDVQWNFRIDSKTLQNTAQQEYSCVT